MDLEVIIKFGGARSLKLLQTVLSLLQGGISINNIIIVGSVECVRHCPILKQCRLLETASAKRGALGQMINLGVKNSTSEFVLICDDDIFFPDMFFEKLEESLSGNEDVISFGLMNVDGSRYWDSSVSGVDHSLTPYGWRSEESYITGGAFIARRKVLILIPFSEDLLIGEAEDVDWSKKVLNTHFIWAQKYGLQAIHNDGRCFQKGDVVGKSENAQRLLNHHEDNFTKGEIFVVDSSMEFSEYSRYCRSLTGGWHPPEAWGVWAGEAISFLRFYVKASVSSMSITLRLPEVTNRKQSFAFGVTEMLYGSFYFGSSDQRSITISLQIHPTKTLKGYYPLFLRIDSSAFFYRTRIEGRYLGVGLKKVDLWEGGLHTA